MLIIEKIKNEAIRRKLSQRTIETYCFCVDKFLRSCPKELKYITTQDVKDHLFRLGERNMSENSLNVHLNALKFFFEQGLKRKLTLNIAYSKTPKRLPEFLTKEETIQLIESIKNKKHRLMIKLMYGTGMRVSELLNLKVKDLCFEQNYGWVRQGKGKKDRLFILPLSLKEEILNLIQLERLIKENFLFISSWNKPYSVHSLQLIVKEAAKKAKINKSIHPHTLRHSFATHLIQNGYAVTEVQPLMGHSKMETTMIYLHLASPNLLKVKSPLDSI